MELMDEMDAVVELKKCCPKDCLASFPEDLRVRSIAQMRRWTPREKAIFIMGKVGASVALDDVPDPVVKHAHATSRISYYIFDKNHTICRSAFQFVYEMSDIQMRAIKRQLTLPEIDFQRMEESQAKKEQKKSEHLMVEIDPSAELSAIRKAMITKCCPSDCLSKIPEMTLAKTRAKAMMLSEREKYMFLAGKVSSCLSIVGSKFDTPTPTMTSYNFDKDYPLCKPAFRLVFDISEQLLRKVRDRLFNNQIEYEPRDTSLIKVDETDDDPDTRSLTIEQELAAIEEAKNVQRASFRGCCQRGCMTKIPAEMLAQIRLQVHRMSTGDRHAFLMGKICSSVSIVRLSIVPNETQARATYMFDRDHSLCALAFTVIYAGCRDQCQRLRSHLVQNGISLMTHGLTGKPSNSKGKSVKRKTADTVIDADTRLPELDFGQGSAELTEAELTAVFFPNKIKPSGVLPV